MMLGGARLAITALAAAIALISGRARADEWRRGGAAQVSDASDALEPDVVPALAIGAGWAGASLAVGGTLVVRATSDAAKVGGVYVVQTGLVLAPMVSHALLGEWKRGALFSVPPAVASMGMIALLGARPHTVAGGTSAYQYAFSSLLALTVFSSMIGVFDVASFAGRKERSDLVLAPVLDGREIGVRARGSF